MTDQNLRNNHSRWHELLVTCRYNPKIIPILLSLLRIALCFWPQLGYLHPDEFRQSSDIIAGNYFKSNIHKAWEFNTDKPIRCMLFPQILNTIAFKIITFHSYEAQPSAYWLLVAPRLVYTIFSFIIDYCLYKLCQYYLSRLWYLPISVIFQSSFICLGCLTRTLSNVPEVVLFAILLVLVCRTIKPRFRVLFVTPARTRPANERVRAASQYFSSIIVGFILALGTFNRPTFPCFALVPMTYWFLESSKRNSYEIGLIFKRALAPLIMSAMFTSSLISMFDTAYYQDLKTVRNILEHLFKLDLDNFLIDIKTKWIFTPYNFIEYNRSSDNLSKYGLHLPYVHMLINVPVYFNLVGLVFYRKLISLILGSGIYRLIFSSNRIQSMMIMSTITPIIILSFIPHQEFRFLIPIIVPLAYTFAFEIYASNRLLPLWFILNVTLLYFYSCVHQVGVTGSTLDISHLLKSDAIKMQNSADFTKVNVFAFRCYDVPSYLWNIPANDKRFNLDIGGTFQELNSTLVQKFNKFLPEEELQSQLFYTILPTIYEVKLANFFKENFQITSWKILKHYQPHFTGEDFDLCMQDVRKNGLTKWKDAFSFSLIETKLTEKEFSV